MPNLPWGDLTPFGLLLGAVAMVLLGWLIPRWTLNEIIARERQRGDEWRAAAEAKAAEAQVLVAQLAELIELGRTTDAFIRSLRAPTSTAAHPEE